MSGIGKVGPGGVPIDETRSKERGAPVSTGNSFVDAFSRAVGQYGENTAKVTPSAPQAPKEAYPGITHAAHIPIPGAVVLKGSGDADDLQERALRFRSYRQELLAANIANADTPNYKAVDIDIEAALKAGYTRVEDIPILYRTPSQGAVDGNTVELDFERAEFARNAIMYQFTVNKVGHEYKEMGELFKNLSM